MIHTSWPEDVEVFGDPTGFDEWMQAYGVRLSMVGEDGAWVALGRVEPLRMIAAMRKAGRSLGLRDDEVFGYLSPEDGPLTVAVRQTRAVFTADHTGAYPWIVWWGEDFQSHPDSVEVTRWTV